MGRQDKGMSRKGAEEFDGRGQKGVEARPAARDSRQVERGERRPWLP